MRASIVFGVYCAPMRGLRATVILLLLCAPRAALAAPELFPGGRIFPEPYADPRESRFGFDWVESGRVSGARARRHARRTGRPRPAHRRHAVGMAAPDARLQLPARDDRRPVRHGARGADRHALGPPALRARLEPPRRRQPRSRHAAGRVVARDGDAARRVDAGRRRRRSTPARRSCCAASPTRRVHGAARRQRALSREALVALRRGRPSA
jgi:hypothetical protein